MNTKQINIIEEMYVHWREGKAQVNFGIYIPDLIKTIRTLEEKAKDGQIKNATSRSISPDTHVAMYSRPRERYANGWRLEQFVVWQPL